MKTIYFRIYSNFQLMIFVLIPLLADLTGTASAQLKYTINPSNIQGVRNGAASFADVNNDGFLDFIVTGDTSTTATPKPFTGIYLNDGNGNFNLLNTDIAHLANSSVAWGDFNQDNNVDLFICGENESQMVMAYLYQGNGNGQFTEMLVNIGISLGTDPKAAFADFDNDGDQDMLLVSSIGVEIYANQGSDGMQWNFEKHQIMSGNFTENALTVGDFNNDGFIDFMVSGRFNNTVGTSYFANTGYNLNFISSQPLAKFTRGAFATADIDNDGDLDIGITGRDEYSNRIGKIYKNNGTGTFTEVRSFPGDEKGSLAFGDCDGDGDADLIWTGKEGSNYICVVDTNNGTGSFGPWATNEFLEFRDGASIAFGDINNDGRMDVIACGWVEKVGYRGPIAKLYNKTTVGYPNPNIAPTVLAAGLSQQIFGDSVVLSWNKYDHLGTTKNYLSYNVRIKKDGTLFNAPLSTDNGRRLIAQAGNAGLKNSMILPNLPEGFYAWSVQAIDQSYQASNWSYENNFIVSLVIPNCQTMDAAMITDTSALLSGMVTFPENDSTPTDVFFILSTDDFMTNMDTLPYPGNPLKYSRTCTYQKSSLQSETTYQYKIFVRNINGSREGGVKEFVTFPKTPILQTQSVAGNPTAGNPLTINANILNITMHEIRLEYGKPFKNLSSFSDTVMDNTGLNIYSATIPASQVTTEGIAYRFHITRISSPYLHYYFPPDGKYFIASVGLPAQELSYIRHQISAYPGGIPTDGWNSVSLPYEFKPGGNNILDLTQIFGSQRVNNNNEPLNWSLLKIDNSNGQFEKTTSMTHLTPYFLYHKMGWSQIIDSILPVNTDLITSRLNINDMVVGEGWQMIPWPYLFTAQFNRKTVPGNPSQYRCGKLWILTASQGWLNENDFGKQLKPYAAYAFHSKAPNQRIDSLLHIYRSPVIEKETAALENTWEVRIRASAGQSFDLSNAFGTSPYASDALDDIDDFEPPKIGHLVRAYFINDKTDQPLSYDFRTDNHQGKNWNLIIENPANESSLRLDWESLRLPADIEVYMVDFQNNQTINMRSVQSYTFKAIAKNHFTIFSGSTDYVNTQINALHLPDRFELYSNYPNPFNPGTHIRYDLKHSSTVTLSVYNSLGQLVRILVNGKTQTSGSYNAYWDGKDAHGRPVSSGVYIYRIDIKDINGKTFRKSNKMVLLK